MKTARGRRAEVARKMAGLSRKQVCEKYGISTSTIQSWEDGKAGGLTAKGANRLTKAYSTAGIIVDPTFLLFGEGRQPAFKEGFVEGAAPIAYNDKEFATGSIDEDGVFKFNIPLTIASNKTLKFSIDIKNGVLSYTVEEHEPDGN